MIPGDLRETTRMAVPPQVSGPMSESAAKHPIAVGLIGTGRHGARYARHIIDDLTMSDADFLMSEFERVDCGIDTAIEIECPSCWAVQEIELPFGKTFFMPGRTRKPSSDQDCSSPQ